MKMSKEYLAGLIDGEGYLGILARKPDVAHGGINTYYYCVFKLALTGLHAQEVTRMIADRYKGWVYKRNVPTVTGKDVYTVEIKSKPRIKVLMEDIAPYLIVKSEQAQIMLEFLNLPSSHPNYFKYSPESVAQKAILAEKLKSYTRRTPLATTE